MQKVLIVNTLECNLRSKIIGWSVEDSDLFVAGKEIGFTTRPHIQLPNTVLEALSMGWKLLSSPTKKETKLPFDAGKSIYESNTITEYTWWLVKD